MSLDGRPYAPRNPLDARRAGVAMIYQELSLAPHLSVMENILLGVEPIALRARRSHAHARDGGPARSRELGHDDIPPDALVGTSLVAAQQLVEIARALAVGCRVLVLDEPTSSLARDDVERLFELIAPAESAGPRDRLHLALHRGSEGGLRIASSCCATAATPAAARPPETRADAIVGDDGRAARSTICIRAARAQPGEALLEVDALEPGGATFTLQRGEILGIAGLLGAGRTRLLRTIFGLEPVQGGRVTRRRGRSGPRRAARSRGGKAWACSARIARAKGSRSA